VGDLVAVVTTGAALGPPAIIAIAVVAVVLVAATWWLWWRLPQRQVRGLDIPDAKGRADAEDNFRKTVGQQAPT
jgi:hypothetical protein